METNRIFHVGKLNDLWNEGIQGHVKASPGCEGRLELDMTAEKQWGLAWIERLTCTVCTYVSRHHKLFEGVRTGERGPESAAINCAVQVALTQTPIGNDSFRKLLLAANIPVPSTSSMHSTGQYVQKHIVEANVSDMQARTAQAKQIQTAREEQGMPFEADGVYNIALYGGAGKTPMVPSTQSCFTMAEQVTKKRQIVQLNTKNKLCVRCRLHRRRHLTGQHPGKCTATLAMQENIGNEEKRARECLEVLLEQGIEVSELTTDGDSSIYRAAEAMYKEGKVKTKPVHYLDTRHLADNQRKKTKNARFSSVFMPGKTKKDRDSMQTCFASDLAKRCEAEFAAWMSKCSGDILSVKRNMTFCVPCIVKCYSGDHSDCYKASQVCKGSSRRNWLALSTYLPRDFRVNPTSQDEQTLTACINYRLGQHILEKTRKSRNSQKVEAVNRSLRRSLPKNVTYSTSMEGRAHSAVYSVNNGPGDSIILLCQRVGCPIKPGTRVAKALAALQRTAEYKRTYNRSLKMRIQRVRTRAYMYKLYDSRPVAERKVQHYKKGKLFSDHTYAKL